MIIDGHLHNDHELPADELVKLMERDGVDKAVLFAGFWEGIQYVPDWQTGILRKLLVTPLLKKIALKIYNDFHHYDVEVDGRRCEIAVKLFDGSWHCIPMRPDNETVARARDKYPERIIPFVFLNAMNNPELMSQFERWVDREGFKGVKVHTWSHPFDITAEFLEVAKGCEARGIPVLMHHGGTPESSNVEGLMRACPKLKLILAHAGVPFFERSFGYAKNYESLYLDVSGPYLGSPKFLKGVADAVGADKLIWGSDGGWGLALKDGGFGYGPSLNRMKEVGLSDEDFQAIIGGNLEKVLGGVD